MEYSDYLENLDPAGVLTGDEIFGISQGGAARSLTLDDIADYVGAGGGTTFEFGRAWSSELLFDKNEIYYADHTQTGAINFTIAAAGNLVDGTSVIRQRITSDGTNTISFTGFDSDYIKGITSGDVLPAGDYEFWFNYVNGTVSVSVPGTTVGSGITREFNRTWTDTLEFDKNEIYYSPHVMDDDIDFVLGTDHLVNETSSAVQIITADGEHALNFTSDFNFIYGIENGDILEAGTYQVFFLYTNGSVTVNVPGISSQSSGLTKLATPGNFAVVADGENALDLSWTDVADEVGYQIEKSLTGVGGWVLFSNPAANATSDTETGLNPGDTIFYRIKALGDGVTFSDSNYATASGTTEDTGDVTAPTFTFDPVNGVTTWPVNKPITITANEPLRKDDGSELVSNDTGIITLKETNSGGADIACTWTIDVSKTIITITPTTLYGAAQVVYVAIDGVEDVSGNESSLSSATFTTTSYSYLNGISDRIIFGDILDSLFSVADTNFWIELTIQNHSLSGTRVLCGKTDFASNQRSFFWTTINTDIYIYLYNLGDGTRNRVIKWTNVLTSGEHDLQLRYDGSIDTNNGLDRVTLFIDGVNQNAFKTLDYASLGSITTFNLFNSTAQLSVGNVVNSSGVPGASYYFVGEAKDFVIRSTAGSVVEINVPVLADGQDISGNNRDGTWV